MLVDHKLKMEKKAFDYRKKNGNVLHKMRKNYEEKEGIFVGLFQQEKMSSNRFRRSRRLLG